MVSTEEEKVPHVDEAEEFATAINYKSIIIHLSEIINQIHSWNLL